MSHPAKAGLLQALGVFFDTIVICSCTAFIMLVTPAADIQGLEGMGLLQASMEYHLGQFGVIFIAVILWLFSFSTFIGILFYALLQCGLPVRRPTGFPRQSISSWPWSCCLWAVWLPTPLYGTWATWASAL